MEGIHPILVPVEPLNMTDIIESTKLKEKSYLSVLESLRKIGIFPCKRVTNEESGMISLEPTNCKLQLLFYCIAYSILSSASTLSMILIQHVVGSNLNILDFLIEFYKVGVGLHHSKFDLNLQGFFILFAGIIHLIILISLVAAKQDLCNVFNYLKCNIVDNLIMTKFVKKHCDWHLIKMGFCFVSFICFLTGFAMNNINHFNFNIWTISPILICWSFFNGWFLAPVMAFHIYFLEISLMLVPWSWSLKDRLNESPSNYHLLEEAKKVLTSLEMISKTISKIIFWLFTLVLVATIICTYIMVAFFLTQEEFTLPVILNMLGYGGVVSLYFKFAYGYCVFTQDIKEIIHSIKRAILDLDINSDDILTLNGKPVRAKHWQKRIASGFEEFQGFHGNNYFVLGKPLLSSITANFITYLTILVQFKVSELSVK